MVDKVVPDEQRLSVVVLALQPLMVVSKGGPDAVSICGRRGRSDDQTRN